MLAPSRVRILDPFREERRGEERREEICIERRGEERREEDGQEGLSRGADRSWPSWCMQVRKLFVLPYCLESESSWGSFHSVDARDAIELMPSTTFSMLEMPAEGEINACDADRIALQLSSSRPPRMRMRGRHCVRSPLACKPDSEGGDGSLMKLLLVIYHPCSNQPSTDW